MTPLTPVSVVEATPEQLTIGISRWGKPACECSRARDRAAPSLLAVSIAQYGSVTLKSENGLWEEFQFSNPERLVNFLNALNSFTASFEAVAHV
jgi:hypothetical protein